MADACCRRRARTNLCDAPGRSQGLFAGCADGPDQSNYHRVMSGPASSVQLLPRRDIARIPTRDLVLLALIVLLAALLRFPDLQRAPGGGDGGVAGVGLKRLEWRGVRRWPVYVRCLDAP